MPRFSARTAPVSCLALAALGASLAASPEGHPSIGGSAYASLAEDALALRLSLGAGPSYLGLGLEAGEAGPGLSAAWSLASAHAPEAYAESGPGALSGLARILVDPTSPTALSPGRPVALDRSLASRSSVLGIGAGPLSLFATARGSGAARDLESAAAGLCLGSRTSEGGLTALAAASFPGAAAQSEGWRPDPYSSPALTASDLYAPCLSFALVARRPGAAGTSLAGLAASYGRLAGPGLAFRLETQDRLGPLSLRLAAAAAGGSFRGLSGPRQERLLLATAEARLPLRRASALSLELETRAEGAGLLYAPLWGGRASLGLDLPADAAHSIEARLDLERSPSAASEGSASLALVEKSEEAGAESSSRLGIELRWAASGLAGARLAVETALRAAEGLPALGLDLALELFEGGDPDSPVLARGGAFLTLPLGAGAASSLELRASLPDAGLALGPLSAAWRGTSVEFGLRYRSSLPSRDPSRSRPRSRMPPPCASPGLATIVYSRRRHARAAVVRGP